MENEIKKIIKYNHETMEVSTHESKKIEFKQNFNFNNKKDYFRAMASFANAGGGNIFFGVTDKPRKLVGLSKDRTNDFNNMKLEEFTVDLNNFFSPEISWNSFLINMDENITVGVIHIDEAMEKPIICKKRYESKEDKNCSTIEGEIYYRYFARNERIHYEELLKIINYEKEKENKKWMDLFSKISKIGVNNIGLLNFNTGIFSAGNNSVVLDDEMISNIKFIKEGEFNERKGIPTLNVIGNVQIKQNDVVYVPQKEKIKGIRVNDIINDFLIQKNVENGIDYITQICFESTAFLPIYYYINKCGRNIDDVVTLIEGEVSRSSAKNKLIERIKTKRIEYSEIKSTNKIKSILKKEVMIFLEKGNIDDFIEKYDIYKFLSIITSLERNIINDYKTILLPILRGYYMDLYQIDKKFASLFRNAICWIDEALYMKNS